MKTKIPVQLGQKYNIQITGMGQSGEGVGRYENFTVFVPYALPGETVEAKITLVKKNYATGEIVSIIEKASERIKPVCPVYDDCGACQLQHYSYEAQLNAKQQKVIDMMEHIAIKKDIIIHPTLPSVHEWHYRNKMQFPIGRSKKEGIIVGCYAHSSHNIINTQMCHIQKHTNNVIANAVREMATKFKLSVYDEKTHYGLLRHVVGRTNRDETQAMVVLVTAQPKIPRVREIVDFLRSKIPNLTSIVQNINTGRNNIIMGKECKILWGASHITDRLGSLKFKISALSFFQVNTEQAERLYECALKYANLTGKETVIDGYCGTGTISLFLAQKAKKVYGMEIVPEAIRDAVANARDNNIRNAEFMTGDAARLMPQLYRKGLCPDVIVTDPPRAGCAPEVLKIFAAMRPKRIVYVSCNPASLARDIAILDELGYKAVEVQPVDMFPQTGHVETVCLLTREKSVKSYAYVDITPSELGMGGKVKKPTYKQIQAYVLETHGLKVSPLYIANVKDEFGLEKQFSYEEAGMSAKKRPNCPPEKRAAIIDALIHFGMLDEDARETE